MAKISKSAVKEPDVTKQDLINDIKRLQEEFPSKTITRDFYRKNGSYSEKHWVDKFGIFATFKREAELTESKEEARFNRAKSKHRELDIYRRFFSEEVLSYHRKYEKSDKDERYKTLVIGSDFHDIHSDTFVLSVFIRTCEMLQPDIIVLNGDVFDLYEFSHFDQDPEQCDLEKRFNFVQTHIFKALRKACPDSQIDFIIGNHELRLIKMLASKHPALRILMAGPLKLNLSKIFGLDEFEINLVTKYDLPSFIKTIDTEKAENFKKYYGCFVVTHKGDYGFQMSGTSGHTHRPKLGIGYNEALDYLTTWNVTGCIKKTYAEYVEGPNKWMNGFGIVHIDVVDKVVNQIPILIPGNFAVIEGVRFVRNDFKDNLPV